MKKRIFAIALVLMLALSFAVSAQALEADTAGNAFESEATVASPVVERDFYWMGESLSLSSAKIGADAIIGGRDLIVSGAEVAGSARMAGYNVTLSGVKAANNMTIGGYSVRIDSSSEAQGVYVGASDASFDGSCSALTIVGANVSINGTVNGDASVFADKVVIGENAVITGTLHVTSANEPVVSAGASIGAEDYTITKVDEEAAAAVVTTATIASRIMHKLYWIAAVALLALVICLLANRSLENAKITVQSRTAAMLISGAVALLAMPMLILLLCLSYFGLPVAGLVTILFLLAMLFAVPFAGASLARLVFPRMNVLLAALIGGAILSAVRIVPVLKTLIYFACVIYTLGYYVLYCFDGFKSFGKKLQNAPVMAQQPVFTVPTEEIASPGQSAVDDSEKVPEDADKDKAE